jgi:hypothetical protein
MKNVHTLSKNSKVKTLGIGLELGINNSIFLNGESHNIYITSDEEIKEGDCVLNPSNKILKIVSKNNEGYYETTLVKGHYFKLPDCKKIILTTDQELIKDGVQAIDDEFLEWFSKNPSCDRVNIEKYSSAYLKLHNINYKIVIPKEEPKQVKCNDKFNQILLEGDYVDVQKDGVQLIYKKEDNQLYFKPYGKEDKVSAYFSNDLVKCDKVGNWITNDRYEDISDEIKQETLEEAIERLLDKYSDKFEISSSKHLPFFFHNRNELEELIGEVIKHQQERSYSEEEVIELNLKYLQELGKQYSNWMNFKDWFNLNKK